MSEQGRLTATSRTGRQSSPAKKSNILECRVCEDTFQLHGDKIPRLLFCGHTLCHACLLRLPTDDGLISCPFDRQQTLLGTNGVWELNKNFALMEMIERIQSQESSDMLSSALLVDNERSLGVCCDEVEDHLAVVYCTVCGTHLCLDCSHATHNTRTLAKHKRIPLSEKPKEKPICSYHGHVMEFTCLEPECSNSPLMCYICKDYGRHKGHNHNLLELEVISIISTSSLLTISTYRQSR